MFNEITERAVQAAFQHPGKIDRHKVDAQQARRVLDRLVGYKLSPLLWEKIRRGLSAGRVQSVAVRMITEREREIQAFVPVEYWSIHAKLRAKSPPEFEATLREVTGREGEPAQRGGDDGGDDRRSTAPSGGSRRSPAASASGTRRRRSSRPPCSRRGRVGSTSRPSAR